MPRQTQPGDVANAFIRFILTQIGADAGGLTTDAWQATLAYFGNCCAYTGLPLPATGYDQDHAVPLNRHHGGLHLYGNVLPALKTANSEKAGRSYDEFLGAAPGLFPSLNHLSPEERQERIGRIRAFMQQAQPGGLLDAHPVVVAFYKAKYEEVKSLVGTAANTARALLQALQVPVPTAAPDADETTQILPDEEQLAREEQAGDGLPPAYRQLFEQFPDDDQTGKLAQAIFAALSADAQLAPYLERLQDADYGHEQFGLYLPVLAPSREMTTGRHHYYATVSSFNGADYYLTWEWKRSHREKLENWLTNKVFGVPASE